MKKIMVFVIPFVILAFIGCSGKTPQVYEDEGPLLPEDTGQITDIGGPGAGEEPGTDDQPDQPGRAQRR